MIATKQNLRSLTNGLSSRTNVCTRGSGRAAPKEEVRGLVESECGAVAVG